MINADTPKWLKEVLDRGYAPERIYNDFNSCLFGFIDQKGIKPYSVKSKAFVLEGLPGGGKTTLLNRLKRLNKYCLVEQILPHEPIDSIKQSDDFYFKSEI